MHIQVLSMKDPLFRTALLPTLDAPRVAPNGAGGAGATGATATTMKQHVEVCMCMYV